MGFEDCAQSLGYSKTSTYYYRLRNGGECRKLKNDSDFWALVTILPPNRVAIVYIVDDNFVPNIESQVAINNCVKSSLNQEEPKVGDGVDAENLVNMDLENLIDVGVEDEDSNYEYSDYERSDAEDDNLFGDIVEKCANEGGNVNVSSSAAAFPNLEFGDVEIEPENSDEFKSGVELLCAIGIDAKNGMYPIPYAIVEIENRCTWTWFLEILINDLRIDNGLFWVFISNKQKGLL
ncbi:hypothetical protein CerSpe_072590 [Prunus speciosa]